MILSWERLEKFQSMGAHPQNLLQRRVSTELPPFRRMDKPLFLEKKVAITTREGPSPKIRDYTL